LDLGFFEAREVKREFSGLVPANLETCNDPSCCLGACCADFV
jgi:hypothetical protein